MLLYGFLSLVHSLLVIYDIVVHSQMQVATNGSKFHLIIAYLPEELSIPFMSLPLPTPFHNGMHAYLPTLKPSSNLQVPTFMRMLHHYIPS